MNKVLVLLFISIFVMILVSCDKPKEENNEPTYRKISSHEAKEMMDTNPNVIILDVRTIEEYNEKHIPNALLIPVDEIKEKAPLELKDKNQIILVYCRSGNRSKTASYDLISLGYLNVYDFGGINEWEYEVVK